jgi:hypothetical protein
MFVARKSQHIEDDLKRNWSSWNFGKNGFVGTRDELNAYLATCTDSHAVFVSGFEIYADAIKDFKFGELHPGYWVAIDTRREGLSCVELKANDLVDCDTAIEEALTRTDYWGDGIAFDARYATHIHRENDIHIFWIE